MQRAAERDWSNAFATAVGYRRGAPREEKRNIAAKLSRKVLEQFVVQPQSPYAVQADERSRRVSRAAGEPGLRRNALIEHDVGSEPNPRFVAEQFGSANHQIIWPRGDRRT